MKTGCSPRDREPGAGGGPLKRHCTPGAEQRGRAGAGSSTGQGAEPGPGTTRQSHQGDKEKGPKTKLKTSYKIHEGFIQKTGLMSIWGTGLQTDPTAKLRQGLRAMALDRALRLRVLVRVPEEVGQGC